MKKYTIKVGGLGADCYVSPLDSEQLTKLKNGGVVDEKMSIDDINHILGVESIFDYGSSYLGAYDDSDLYHIEVLDENGELIEELTDNWDCIVKNDEDYFELHNDQRNLIVEDTCKGEFFEFTFETEDEFDSSKLSPIITEIGECVNIITGLRYDDKVLNITNYNDYWSRGFYFYLT